MKENITSMINIGSCTSTLSNNMTILAKIHIILEYEIRMNTILLWKKKKKKKKKNRN
jgi:hypothetical protein